MSSEHKIQNIIRNGLAGLLPLFRINVGKGWTGNDIIKIDRVRMINVAPGDVVIRNARPFDAGPPAGFSDTFGVLAVTITTDMVGSVIGQAVFGEIKDETATVKKHQRDFLVAMTKHGARAGVWRSLADALQTISKGGT